MAAEIALAFRQHHADKCPETRKGAFQALRTWFGFLEEHGTPIETMRDVDSGVLRAYIAWLDRKEWTKGSQHGAWSVIKQLVAWLKRNHPEQINPISKSRLMHSRARTQPPVRGSARSDRNGGSSGRSAPGHRSKLGHLRDRADAPVGNRSRRRRS